MNLPRPMLKAADTRSCLGMAEGCKHPHDSVYRALGIELEWTNGLIRLPVAFRVCWGDEGKAKSKPALALELLTWAVQQSFKPEYVLFDVVRLLVCFG